MANKIVITEDIFKQAKISNRTVNDVLAAEYAGEIAARVQANPKLAKVAPVHHAMFDAGLSYGSAVQKFYSRSEDEYLFPALVETVITDVRDDAPILNTLVADTRTVPSRDVHTVIANFDTEDNRKAVEFKDVSEGAEIPRVLITTSKSTIRVYKRGLAVESTYEAIRENAIELFLATLRQAMRRAAYSQIGDAINVLVDGDGNKNAAEISSVVGAATITPDNVVDFMMDFGFASDGLTPNVLLVHPDILGQFTKMFVPTDTNNGYRPGTMFNFPQVNFSNVSVIYDKRVPKSDGQNIVIALDSARAIDKYVVANSVINEFDRNITSQKQVGTITEEAGFGKREPKAVRIMRVAAQP